MTDDTRIRRPVLVTVAVVAVYLSGFVNIALGILMMLSRYDVAHEDVLLVSLLGAGVILFGLLTIAAGSSLARGSALARLLISIYVGIQVVLHTITIITTDTWDAWAVAQVIVEVALVVVLWVPPTSRYFRRG